MFSGKSDFGDNSGILKMPARERTRIACLFVADFPAAAITRANPELRERPFVMIAASSTRAGDNSRAAEKDNANAAVKYASPHARESGVRPGMTVAQARALAQGLAVLRPSTAAERSAAEALADVAESLSPVIEQGDPGCVWLDLTGTERSFRHSARASRPGSFEDEIAGELVRRANRVGLEASAGVASTKEVAHLAARCGGVRVIAPDAERDFLNWLPLDLLGSDADGLGREFDQILTRMGIRRLGDLARIDVRAVGRRFGKRGVELHRIAHGGGSSTIVTCPRAEIFSEAVEFDFAIGTLEPMGFVMRAMLEKLTARLEIRGLAGGDITLSLGLEDHRHDDRRVTVAAATNEVRSMLTLINLSLEASPPPAAVETIRLQIEPRTPRPAQGDMFTPPSPAPDRLEATVARIAALCGPQRVGMLTPANSWRREAVRLGTLAPSDTSSHARITGAHPNGDTATSNRGNVCSNVARMILRMVRPCEEVEVMCARATPEFVRGGSICARVVSCAGPWRRQGEWWANDAAIMGGNHCEDGDGTHSDDQNHDRDSTMRNGIGPSRTGSWQANAPAAYARDYYEVSLADGGVYRLYCDLYSGKWFVDGIYD